MHPTPPGVRTGPSPADVAHASTRLRESSTRLSPLAGPGRVVTFGRPREPHHTERGIPVSDVVARDRAWWAECSRGNHEWTPTPLGDVCLHCPIPAAQADRVRAHRRTLTGAA